IGVTPICNACGKEGGGKEVPGNQGFRVRPPLLGSRTSRTGLNLNFSFTLAFPLHYERRGRFEIGEAKFKFKDGCTELDAASVQRDLERARLLFLRQRETPAEDTVFWAAAEAHVCRFTA